MERDANYALVGLSSLLLFAGLLDELGIERSAEGWV